MRKTQIVGVILIIMVLVLEACGTTTTPTTTGIPAEAPEEIISLVIPDFNFVEKSDRVEPIYSREEYSAVSFFTPKANSKFDNKVDHMTVSAHLFIDDASSEQMANLLLIFASSTEIRINGRFATLTYNTGNGEAMVFLQEGRLVIYSLSVPPFDATPFDEVTLKDAAIEGFKAIKF
jgi:hypothetical protein